MRKKITSAIVAMLTATFALSSITGCQTQNAEAEETKQTGQETSKAEISFPLEESVTMSMFAVSSSYTGAQLPDVLAFQTAEKDTNVHWDVTSCLSADLADKRGLILSSGEYPDVLFKSFLTHNEIEKYGSQGVLIPLNDLIENHMPNLKKQLDERNAWQYITAADGNIYALPELSRRGPATIMLWQNNRWLEAVGMEEPTSMEELYQVLKAFKEQDPNGNGQADEIPLEANSSVPPIYLMQYLLPMDYNTFCAVSGDEIVYVPRTEEYKEFLSWLARFYEEGLLEKDCFSKTIDQQYAEGPSDVYGYFYSWSPTETVGAELAKGYDYTVLTPWGDDSLSSTSGVAEGAMAITDHCEYPEIAAAWADQFYSEEGGILSVMGVEGETWQWRDDGKWEYIVGSSYGEDESTVRDNATLQGGAYNPMIWPQTYYKDQFKDTTNVSGSSEEDRLADLCADPFPAIQLEQSDSKRIAEINTDISDYVMEYLAEVTTGSKNLEDTWDSYLEQLDSMGGKEYQDTYNEAYQKMNH